MTARTTSTSVQLTLTAKLERQLMAVGCPLPRAALGRKRSLPARAFGRGAGLPRLGAAALSVSR